MDKKRRWLIATAAVIAVLTLYYYTGSWIVVALFFAAVGVFVAFQGKGKAPEHVCRNCGARLNPNARECRECGSASWSVRE